jgi:hypothetical protein
MDSTPVIDSEEADAPTVDPKISKLRDGRTADAFCLLIQDQKDHGNG